MWRGRYRIDRLDRAIIMDGAPVQLTAKEFELAKLFFENLDRPRSGGPRAARRRKKEGRTWLRLAGWCGGLLSLLLHRVSGLAEGLNYWRFAVCN